MDKKGMISFTVLIIFTLLLSPVLVSAKTTETSHCLMKGAYAEWGDSWVWVYELKEHGPGYKRKVILLEGELVIGEILFESIELDPSEFKWSLSSCWVSTEIDGLNLIIEWETVPLKMNHHLNEKDEPLTVHTIENLVIKEATATLEWGELQLGEESFDYAEVGHYTSAEIIKTK